MTYVAFLALFVGLPFIPLVALLSRRSGGRLTCAPVSAPASARVAALTSASLVALVAVPAAILWDHQAAAWGLWRWSERRTLGLVLWGLPVEEVTFIITLTLLVMMLVEVARRVGPPPAGWMIWRRSADALLAGALGGVVWCALAAVRLALTPGRSHPFYVTYLVECGLPLLAAHWLVGGRTLWRARHITLTIAVGVTLWFTLADSVALRAGVWSLSAADLIGVRLLNTPIEESAFFMVVSLLVAQAYLITRALVGAEEVRLRALWLTLIHWRVRRPLGRRPHAVYPVGYHSEASAPAPIGVFLLKRRDA